MSRYGPWALVAGASEGLGAAFAEALAARGSALVLVARRPGPLEALAAHLTTTYRVEVLCRPLDLSDAAAVATLCDELAELELGLLVYNAAYAPVGDFLERPLDDLLQVIDVNIRGPVLLLRALCPALAARGRGGVVLMSSLAGFQGSPRLSMYAASKAFTTILGEGLWRELRPHGVDVVASCAGAIRTPGYQQSSGGSGGEAPGTLDASAVAERTLAALGRGPRIVPGWINNVAHWLLGRLLPRRVSIGIMAQNTRRLS